MLNILWSDSVTIYFGFRALHTSVWKTISLLSTTSSSPKHVNVGCVVHWQNSVGVRYFNPIKKYKYQPIPPYMVTVPIFLDLDPVRSFLSKLELVQFRSPS